MRRLLATATLAAIGLSLAVPLASAHYNDNKYAADRHTVAWQNTDNPSPATTASDGSQVWMDEVVAAYANFADGIKSWDAVLRPVNGGQPSTCHEDLAQDPNTKGYPIEVYINCPWNTTRATEHTLDGPTSADAARQPISSRVWRSRDLGPAVNGKYTIEITIYNAGQRCGLITSCSPDPSKVVEPHLLYQNTNPARWREVYVINEAAVPTGVNSAFDPTTNRIDVTWAANPEPDASYVVQEKVGDGKWSSGEGAPANRFSRTIDQPGKYQYRVAAVRPAPTKDNANATKKSEYVAASAVDVAHITPPSTAGAGAPNGADGAPDGGDPGVFVPTDPTSPTPATAGGRKPGKGSTSSRPGGSSARPAGSSSRPAGSTAHEPGEAEGEGIDEGFSPELPYNKNQTEGGFEEDDGLNEEAGPTLAGGVPKPRDTRGLLIYMASALTLFVFAMQLTVLVRRSRPALASATTEHYHDDFDDWLGF